MRRTSCPLSPVPWPLAPGFRRRGAALVMALVALLVVTLVAGALVQMLVAAHRQSRRYADELQAQWLAQAGLDRAAAKLRADGDYRGEVWNVPLDNVPLDTEASAAAEPNPAQTGQVTITVDAAAKRIAVEAVFPTDDLHRVLIRRESEGVLP